MKIKDYPDIGERVFCEKLDNGLSIFVVPKEGYFKSQAFFAVNYGGADREFKTEGEWKDTPAGIAHFLEHKMFDMKDGNALNMFYAAGASANAFTSSDITAYHFECTENFCDNLRLLLKFVSTPYFTDESVDKEQGIIGQEIKMVEDSPDYVMYYNLMKLLYREHPLREPVAGTVEEIAKITPQILYDCHKIFYNCANMVLCVVGNVNPEEVVKIASEILPKQAGEIPERDYGNDDDKYPEKRKLTAYMDVGMPMFLAGAKIENGQKKDLLNREMTANLAVAILIGPSSPLYAELYTKGIINQSFLAEYERVAGREMLAFGGESRDPETVISAISAKAGKILEEDIEELFKRQKKSLIGEKLRELNSFSDICYNVSKGCFEGFDPFESIKAIEKITLPDVKKFIVDNLTKDKLAISIVAQK